MKGYRSFNQNYVDFNEHVSCQELLLAELGLGLESKQHAWPLYVSPISLSLYGRLALAEQEISLREGSGSADTPRAMSAWERFLERLERPCIDGRMDTERGRLLCVYVC